MASETAGLVERAISRGLGQLDEYQSKELLRAYDIPAAEERLVFREEEAVQEADQLGYPVVIKGLAENIGHKSEAGLVRLGLQNEPEVRKAYQEVAKVAGPRLQGTLIQQQIMGDREFLAGFTTDPHFGPVLMFGLGGIFTETLSDVSLRLIPTTPAEAKQMLTEIRSRDLLQGLRGQSPVDEDSLLRTLTGLSRIASDHPNIREMDVNPLLVTAEGKVLAVDAMAVLQPTPSREKPAPLLDPQILHDFFHPRSVVFIGASPQAGKWGHLLPTNLKSGSFGGRVELVNIKNGTITGQQAYTSVASLPETPDLAVVTIPAEKVNELLDDLYNKGIKRMVLIASGYSETDEQGKQREQDLVDKANRLGITLLGPNTMGLCNPHHNFYCTGSIVHPQPGSTSMISQSGNMGVQLLSFAEQQGMGIRAFCGSGNEAMVRAEDYLEFFRRDKETRSIMLYLESAKQGRRFFEQARKVSLEKPIILLKGGQTGAGSRAAASHTGALSADSRVFDAMCRQAGLVKVDLPTDFLDLAAAFSSLPLPRGNRVAVVTLGGGWGVVTADMCARYGLEVVDLSQDILDFVDTLLPSYWSRSNPIDLVGENDPSLQFRVIESLASWDGCDAIINLGFLGRREAMQEYFSAIQRVDPAYSPEDLENYLQETQRVEIEYLHQMIGLMEANEKPIYGVRLSPTGSGKTVVETEQSRYNGVFYNTPEKAVKACAGMYCYSRYLAWAKGLD